MTVSLMRSLSESLITEMCIRQSKGCLFEVKDMNLLEKIRNQSLAVKLAVYAVFVILLFVSSGFLVGSVIGAFRFTTHITDIMRIGFVENIRLSAAAAVAGCIIFLAMNGKRNRRNTIDYEKDGVLYAKDKNSGSADWQSEKDIRRNYRVGNIRNTTSTVYGKTFSRGPNNVVSYKKPNGPEGNRNIMIVAPMGSGKTYTYVETEVLQTILRGDSLIINDPKGEVFRNTAKFAMDRGVKVKALMIGEYLPYSDFWNCLKETIDPETERVESGRLNEFCRIYMENAGSGKPGDFFFDNGLNLLTTCVGYIAWSREKDIIEKYIRLYKKVAGIDRDYFIDHAKTDDHPMNYFREAIYREGEKNGFDREELTKLMKDIEMYGSKYRYTIGEVYDTMLSFKEILVKEKEMFEAIPEWHPASAAYRTYITNGRDVVADSACQTVLLALNIFNNVHLKETLSRDGIVLSDINKEQCAFYLVSSDKPGASVYKPILSLFFSFFFKDAMTTFDHEEQISSITGEPNRCKGITAMLEEFYSLGHINNFDTVMTTCRSRHIYVSVIIQHIKLLEELYGKNIQYTIISGCRTHYILGANDQETMNFVSELAGTASILRESHHEEGNLATKMGRDMNVSTVSRKLIMPDEARRWHQKVLIIRQGEQPMELQMFPWTEHWVLSAKPKPGYIHFDFKQLRPYPDSMMPFVRYNDRVDERVSRLKEMELEDVERRYYLMESINSLTSPLLVDPPSVSEEKTVDNNKDNEAAASRTVENTEKTEQKTDKRASHGENDLLRIRKQRAAEGAGRKAQQNHANRRKTVDLESCDVDIDD